MRVSRKKDIRKRRPKRHRFRTRKLRGGVNTRSLVEIAHFTPRKALDSPKEINGIPLTIYMTWHSKQVPPRMKECIDNLISTNPEFDINIYDEAMCEEFIQKHFPDKPEILKAFTTLKPYSYKSDLWRFSVLWLFGGIYIDIKFYSVIPLVDVIKQHGEIFVTDLPISSEQCESKMSIYTGFIISKPGNPIFMQCIEEIVAACQMKDLKESPLSVTGPCLLGKVVRANMTNTNISSIMFKFILDPTNQDPSKGKIMYKNTDIIKQYDKYREEQKAFQVNGEHYAEKWRKGNVFKSGGGRTRKLRGGSPNSGVEVPHFIGRSSKDKPTEVHGVPLIIYQSWNTRKIPPKMKGCIDALIANNPDCDYYLSSDEECRQFIVDNYEKDVVEAFDLLVPGAYKSDLWRYCILYKFGGIYLDIKFKSLVPFSSIINDGEMLVKDIDETSKGCSAKLSLYNGFMISKPQNPLFKSCIDGVVKNCKARDLTQNMLSVTGPCLLAAKYKERDSSSEKTVYFHLVSNPRANNMFPKSEIKLKDVIILTEYDEYREESQVNVHYGTLWQSKKIYKENSNEKK